MMYGRTRYRLHRVLPMRLIERGEGWLRREYRRTHSDWSRRWLDRVSWFTTPYYGARMDSHFTDSMLDIREHMLYARIDWHTTNVRWEMYRTDGPVEYRALGLTGGTHGRHSRWNIPKIDTSA